MTRRITSIVLVLCVPVLAFALGGYQGGLFSQYALYGVATAALALTWGFGGILNLGHAVSFGCGAYVSAWLGIHGGPNGTLLGIVGGTLAAGLVALLIGIVGLRGRVNPITFALLTFIVLFGGIEIANQWTDVTGGFNGLAGIPALHLGTLWLADPTTQRVIVALVAALLVWLVVGVARSPFGGLLALVRDNPVRAASLGYNVPRLRIGVFTFAGLVTGLAGSLFVTQVNIVSPDVVSLALATNFVLWTMIGSRTSIIGGFVVAVVLSFVSNELSNTILDLWLLAVGILFVVVVLVIPDGLAVTLGRVIPRRLRRPPRTVLGSIEVPISVAYGGSLVATGITCTFGTFRAVSDVSLEMKNGEVHCLIGPNGAGKSTLLNALSGTHLPVSGRWRLGETDVSMLPPWRLARRGITRKFQAPSIGPTLTVGQNLALAVWATSRSSWSLITGRWRAELPGASWEILKAGDLSGRLDSTAGSLSHGERQLLELAMTFAGRPRAVLLDEPTAGMTKPESAVVATLLRDQAALLDIPIVVVEHDMSLIRTAASTVTVLQAGRVLAEGTVDEIEKDDRVISAYLGELNR